MIEHQPWPKTPRWFRDVTVTEKIDGTNAAVHIVPVEQGQPTDPRAVAYVAAEEGTIYAIYAQSRNRLITVHEDNAGFAKYVESNAFYLLDTLGPGLHFGEWWGQGIQRNYGMTRKVFSLFNTDKWGDVLDVEPSPYGLAVVPVLYRGPLKGASIDVILEGLAVSGSHAAPGFLNPEGVCIFHHASRDVYKALIELDHLPKSLVEQIEERERPLVEEVAKRSTGMGRVWGRVLELARGA